jgi:putative heme-binding domain-containing protein
MLADGVVELLDDDRPMVRDLAMAELTRRGEAMLGIEIKAALKGQTARLRRNAVWVVNRIGTQRCVGLLNQFLTDPDPSVHQVAVRCLGLNGNEGAAFAKMLTRDPNPATRREVAIALGRRKTAGATEFLTALDREFDRFLKHAERWALIQAATGPHLPENREQLHKGLTHWSSSVRLSALIVLDQMDNGNLSKDEVLPFLSAADRDLQQTAWEIVLKHPDWLEDALMRIRDELLKGEVPEPRRTMLVDALARIAGSAKGHGLIFGMLHDDKTPVPARLLLLDVLAQAREELSAAYIVALRDEITRDLPSARQAMGVVRSRGLSSCDGALEAVVQNSKKSIELRVAALAVSAARRKELSPELFELLLSRLREEVSPADRLVAADALGHSPLSESQLVLLAAALPKCAASELPHLLSAFERSKSADVGTKLVAALEKTPALSALSPGQLRSALKSFPAEVQKSAEPLIRKLAVDEAAQRAKLAELAGVWKNGDVNRGRSVFFGKKAQCAACHSAQGQGERIGPDLSKIGASRTETDLLESIVFPSNSIARGFESYVVHATDGKSFTGVMRRETADAVVLMTAERAEVRLPRNRIESIELSKTSIMPQGLDSGMSRQELGDVIAFLKSLK